MAPTLRRIVVPLDGNFESVRSVEEAWMLASRSNARLLMLHIVDSRPETERAPASPVFVDYPRYELEAWQDEFLRSSFAIAGRPRNANMVVALHPLASNQKAFALCCDDYLVTHGGAERLHKTPQEVFVINC